MSEDRYEQDEGEDVDAHQRRAKAAADEPVEDTEDVKAHGRHHGAMTVEPSSDDESDDVEAHARRASHHHGV